MSNPISQAMLLGFAQQIATLVRSGFQGLQRICEFVGSEVRQTDMRVRQVPYSILPKGKEIVNPFFGKRALPRLPFHFVAE